MGPHVGLVPQVRERADAHVVGQPRVGDDRVVEHRDTIADLRVDDSDAAVDFAALANRREAFERDAGVNNRVGAD